MPTSRGSIADAGPMDYRSEKAAEPERQADTWEWVGSFPYTEQDRTTPEEFRSETFGSIEAAQAVPELEVEFIRGDPNARRRPNGAV